MGIAKGQDPQAEELLQNPPSYLRLSMPSICFVEALTTREEAEKYQLNFLRQVDIQINEAEQDYADNARLLVTQLEQLRTSYLERNNQIQERFDLALNQLMNQAEIIPLNADIIQEVLNRDILQKHIIDKIILQCIVNHAKLHPDEIKVFLSGNSHEFGKREVTDILRGANIQYFTNTQNFIGWLQSQSNSSQSSPS